MPAKKPQKEVEPADVLRGQRLRDIRKEKGISQVKLAQLAGYDPTTISRAELGKLPIGRRLLTALALALKVHPDDIYGEGIPEEEAERDPYPARLPLLEDLEFLGAPADVREKVLTAQPANGEQLTTRFWYELFSAALKEHERRLTGVRMVPKPRV